MPSEPLHTVCPHCKCRMELDPRSGEVLAHEPPPAALDAAAHRATEGRANARRDAFEAALRAERDRERDLEDRFREASEKQSRREQDEDAPGHDMDDRWR